MLQLPANKTKIELVYKMGSEISSLKEIFSLQCVRDQYKKIIIHFLHTKQGFERKFDPIEKKWSVGMNFKWSSINFSCFKIPMV